MVFERKKDYFGDYSYGNITKTVLANVNSLYRQERDWTCCIACFRTILSGNKSLDEIPSEDWIVNQTNLIMGPLNSENILNSGILNGIDYKIGFETKVPDINPANFLVELMSDYNVMVECMLNYAHWIVLLGYIKLGNIEQDRIVYYDPYYHRVNIMVADEFFTMWHDVGKNALDQDYIAVKKILK